MSLLESASAVPVWDGLATSLEAYEKQVKLYVLNAKKDDRICAESAFCRSSIPSQMLIVASNSK